MYFHVGITLNIKILKIRQVLKDNFMLSYVEDLQHSSTWIWTSYFHSKSMPNAIAGSARSRKLFWIRYFHFKFMLKNVEDLQQSSTWIWTSYFHSKSMPLMLSHVERTLSIELLKIRQVSKENFMLSYVEEFLNIKILKIRQVLKEDLMYFHVERTLNIEILKVRQGLKVNYYVELCWRIFQQKIT